jgi:hypothetical protein
MASQHGSRRARKLRRRVSSITTGWPQGSPKSLASAPIARRTSLSPVSRTASLTYQRPHLTDGSDYEDYHRPATADSLPRGRSTSPVRNMFEKRPPPTAYASLPPTPIQPSRPFSPPTPVSPISPTFRETSPTRQETYDAPFSLWDYLQEELLATDFDSHQELKWERVSNFLKIPLAMEKVRQMVLTLERKIYVFIDNRLWLHSLLRFLPLHLHHSTDTICASTVSIYCEHLQKISTTSSSISKS